MASEHRITESNPIHYCLGHVDYQRCAALHNELFFRGWTGAGNTWTEPPTWWEFYSPPEAFASRLHPSLIEFLKLAYHIPCETVQHHDKWENLFYFVRSLSGAEYMLSRLGLDSRFGPDRFLLLYPSTGFMLGDEEGIVFDQHTMKATYITNMNDTRRICSHEWAWMPLEAILDGYLQMADEGKVSIVRNFRLEDFDDDDEDPLIEVPWLIHPYTKTDVSKAVAALRRLIAAIDSRIDRADKSEMNLPWHDPVTLHQDFIPPASFAHEFLTAISTFTVRFRYIAPGIRFPTVSEFLDQRLGDFSFPGDCSLRVFQVDNKEEQPGSGRRTRMSGLFIDQVVTQHPEYFANGCSLSLPFTIGANGWARMSNGEPFEVNKFDWLYQSGYFSNGFTNYRSVQIHKVLQSWAERVEAGDWEVGDDGVKGGIGKFREADTEEHWRKYWVPFSW